MATPLSGPALAELAPLGTRFYQRPTRLVARDLLGKLLVRRLPEGVAAVRITEVEAYLGVRDPAAHTYRGRRTPRTETMWGEAGRLYVFFTYGMHHCANVVTRPAGVPEAVLLRGAVPVAGEALIAARRAGPLDGPAKLCRGLDVDLALDGADLTAGGAIWLGADAFAPRAAWVRRLPRVGVAYAGEAAGWPLRFLLDLGAPAAGPRLAARRGGGAAPAARRSRPSGPGGSGVSRP